MPTAAGCGSFSWKLSSTARTVTVWGWSQLSGVNVTKVNRGTHRHLSLDVVGR